MNIIDAWKKAGKEDKIYRPATGVRFDKEETIRRMLEILNNDDQLLDESWEVERVPLVWAGEVRWKNEGNWSHDGPYYPEKIAGNLNFKFLVGKRTKIRIEEILED